MTQDELKLLYSLLNTACFEGKLPMPVLTFGYSEEPSVFGLYYPAAMGTPRIHLDERCTTFEYQAVTMAHEMVHQLQDIEGKPTHHGNFFRSQAARIKRLTGISI